VFLGIFLEAFGNNKSGGFDFHHYIYIILKKRKYYHINCLLAIFLVGHICVYAQPLVYVNQVAINQTGPKVAVIRMDSLVSAPVTFNIVDNVSSKIVFVGTLSAPTSIDEWVEGKYFYQADFSSFEQEGEYIIAIRYNAKIYKSEPFHVGKNALAIRTIPAIVNYYHKQRANTATELMADANVRLYGSEKMVDLRGGWCDASGDVSKYFSHLAYANFMSPQQIPLVTWSLLSALNSVPMLLQKLGVKDSLLDEATWGANYIMRSLSKDDYFYMIVFSYFNKDPNARRVVGLKANSVTNNDYACAFREGGGMAIAALARISQLKTHGDFTSNQYLDAAKRAFAHLLKYNKRYDDDGKENIIDDYCALMAAVELWIATDDVLYQTEARKRAQSLSSRLSPAGYFIADDNKRPFWHASDAGLPVVALARYMSKEKDKVRLNATLSTIKKALDYQVSVAQHTGNPFGYAKQHFIYKDSIKEGFFIPHENETGWWWQGENARLASLATAALIGSRLLQNSKSFQQNTELSRFASQQIDWIMGKNPYSICFMYGFGKNNVPYMQSNFGHGSEKGGISNGITGKDGNGDGRGIDFKTTDNGNEWRWTEQWIPHAAWFLQALAAMGYE